MVRDEICVCGHPQSLHRTYACNGSHPNPDPKKLTVSAVCAKHSKKTQSCSRLATNKIKCGPTEPMQVQGSNITVR